MFTDELAEAGVYLTEHEPLESVQEALKSLPTPLLDHVTVPVGEDPMTAALQLVDEPTTTEEGLQLTATE